MRNNTTQIFTGPNHVIIILQKKSTIYKKNIFFKLVGPLNRIKVDNMLFWQMSDASDWTPFNELV